MLVLFHRLRHLACKLIALGGLVTNVVTVGINATDNIILGPLALLEASLGIKKCRHMSTVRFCMYRSKQKLNHLLLVLQGCLCCT